MRRPAARWATAGAPLRRPGRHARTGTILPSFPLPDRRPLGVCVCPAPANKWSSWCRLDRGGEEAWLEVGGVVFSQGFRTEAEIEWFDDMMHELARIVAGKYNGSLKAEHGTGRNMAPFVEMEWGARGLGSGECPGPRARTPPEAPLTP